MAGEYINSKAGKKRIKKQWKNREKKMNYTLLRTLPLQICGRGVGAEFIPFLIVMLAFLYNNVAVSLVLGR